MGIASPRVPASGFGRGGDTPSPPTGGGDDARHPNYPDYGARLRKARLGLACAIATVSVVFVCLTTVFLLREKMPVDAEGGGPLVVGFGKVELPWMLLAINTVLLLISSVTMELARRDTARRTALAPLRSIPGISLGAEYGAHWLAVTAGLGAVFLAGQWMAWGELKARGFYVNTNPNSSFVYLLTAAHAVHLAGGVAALLWAWMTFLLRRPVEVQRIAVDVTAWYWHFMTVLWVYVFGLLSYAG